MSWSPSPAGHRTYVGGRYAGASYTTASGILGDAATWATRNPAALAVAREGQYPLVVLTGPRGLPRVRGASTVVEARRLAEEKFTREESRAARRQEKTR